jgi:hypothetical protein
MFEPVQPVPAAPPATSGLVRSAITPGDDGVRWENGVAWAPERCPQARTFDPCADEAGFEDPAIGVGDSGVVYYRPPAFRVEYECSTRSNIDGEGRVRRQALAVTSYMVARELQTGARSTANPYETPDSGGVADQVNARLASPAANVIAGTFDPLAGIGALEEAARDAALGQDVFIHVPVSVVPLIDGALRREGTLLFTKTGATVVADAGYGNVGPDGTPSATGVWAYATGPVVVRLGEVMTNVITSWRENTQRWVADRLFAAYFDPCNLHALVLAVPAPGA